MYGLSPEDIKKIKSVFMPVPQVESVVIFGSRAIGTYHPGSDIDLCLKGDIDLSIQSRIENALDSLNLIYQFDIVLYNRLTSQNILEHIDKKGALFYSKEQN